MSVTVENSSKQAHLEATWLAVSKALRTEVSVETYDRWFKDVWLADLSDEYATLSVPNSIYQYWIEDNYLGMLKTAVLMTLQGAREIRFTQGGNGAASVEVLEMPKQQAPVARVKEEAEDKGAPNGINSRNSFESFVVGSNNEFAHAACLAAAQNPGKVYNPLFIYGGVGLGKTHLLHAIGQHIASAKKGAKVCYVSSERFTNEFIDAIQTGGLVKFRKRYRQADVLLIDDIQFLSGKERSQEEFFHTFNTLFDGHKQIVLSSDKPPAEINGLEHRMVSRFEWGLTAELQPPDVETRTAILNKKAATLGVTIEKHLIHFLAERIKTNVRRLEGALMRVASFISLSGATPSPDRIEMLLKDILQEEARRAVTIEQIQKRVAEHFDVRIADMTSKRRPKNIAFPRQIAMYISRERTKASLSEIGEAFGGRDHGTVLHAHRLVRGRIQEDEKLRQVVKFLDDQLQR